MVQQRFVLQTQTRQGGLTALHPPPGGIARVSHNPTDLAHFPALQRRKYQTCPHISAVPVGPQARGLRRKFPNRENQKAPSSSQADESRRGSWRALPVSTLPSGGTVSKSPSPSGPITRVVRFYITGAGRGIQLPPAGILAGFGFAVPASNPHCQRQKAVHRA